MNLPNYISLARLIMVPVFLIFLTANPPMVAAALTVFIIAALSDALDGIIARKTNSISALGRFLDPMADKILIVSAFTALAILKFIPLWLAIIVIARDFFLFTGWLGISAIGGNIAIRPTIYSKATTVFQMLTVIAVLSGLGFRSGLYYAAAVLTVVSGLHYIIRLLLEITSGEAGND